MAGSDRNWSEYNEKLRRHGELFYLDLDFLKNYDKELELINKGKGGRRFGFPPSFLRFLVFVHVLLHIPYRQLDGFSRKLSELIPGMKATDYTNIWECETKFDIPLSETIKETNEPIMIDINEEWVTEIKYLSMDVE